MIFEINSTQQDIIININKNTPFHQTPLACFKNCVCFHWSSEHRREDLQISSKDDLILIAAAQILVWKYYGVEDDYF